MSSARAARIGAVALALGALASSSCVRARYQKSTVLRPIPLAVQSELELGANLRDCLASLGAPSFVWEQPNGAVAIAYAWSRSVGWGVGVSATIVRNVDASFDYDDLSASTRGLVLWFDSSWKLTHIERGRLRDLAAPLVRPRPNLMTPRPEEGSTP